MHTPRLHSPLSLLRSVIVRSTQLSHPLPLPQTHGQARAAQVAAVVASAPPAALAPATEPKASDDDEEGDGQLVIGELEHRYVGLVIGKATWSFMEGRSKTSLFFVGPAGSRRFGNARNLPNSHQTHTNWFCTGLTLRNIGNSACRNVLNFWAGRLHVCTIS